MQRSNLKLERVVYQWIEAELVRARAKYPTSAHSVLALCEESGELARAALNYKYGTGTLSDVLREAVQVAAMALRVITEGDPSIYLPAGIEL